MIAGQDFKLSSFLCSIRIKQPILHYFSKMQLSDKKNTLSIKTEKKNINPPVLLMQNSAIKIDLLTTEIFTLNLEYGKKKKKLQN